MISLHLVQKSFAVCLNESYVKTLPKFYTLKYSKCFTLRGNFWASQ